MTTALQSAALAFWKATGGDRLPSLPENPADAAAAVLRARPKETWACTFGAVDLPDPWPALAVGEGDVTWPEVVWALGCADLVACATAHDGSVLVIDRAPDPRGEHRAFFVSRTGEVLGPWFSSTTSLMEWAATLAESPDDDDDSSELDREPPPRDLWNRSTLSGVGALAAWRQFSPARYYRAARLRQWPDNTYDPGTVREGDPTRTNLLRVVGRFAKTRALAWPATLDAEALTDAQRTHLARLQEIARALGTSAVPPYVATLADRGDAPYAAAARAWIAQYEGARAAPTAAAKRPAKAARPESDELKAVYNAVQGCLLHLSTEGAIELSPENRGELVEEILAAMMKAGSADRAVLAAVGVVTESPLVEEVFADDLLLKKAFRKALGRG